MGVESDEESGETTQREPQRKKKVPKARGRYRSQKVSLGRCGPLKYQVREDIMCIDKSMIN